MTQPFDLNQFFRDVSDLYSSTDEPGQVLLWQEGKKSLFFPSKLWRSPLGLIIYGYCFEQIRDDHSRIFNYWPGIDDNPYNTLD